MRKITLLLFLISSIIFAQINVDGMDPFSNFQDLPSDTGMEKYGSDENIMATKHFETKEIKDQYGRI